MTQLSKVRQSVRLKCYTTFKIGGNADELVEVYDVNALVALLESSSDRLVLGRGSNVLVGDKGVRGLTIINRTQNVEFKHNLFEVDSGLSLSMLSKIYLQGGYSGLEWAVGIPGSVGGACKTNAGAFGGEVSSVLHSLDVIRNGKLYTLLPSECDFRYRGSSIDSDTVVLRARFNAVESDKERLLTLKEQYVSFRKQTQPFEPSAGSVFLRDEKPAGWYIDVAGLKGLRCGGAMVSQKHANFIINTGNATAENVAALIDTIKAEISVKFNVVLKEEIRYIGEF